MEEKIYGQWAGNPKGIKQNPERCIQEVMGDWYSHQCNRKKKIGDYCKQHADKIILTKSDNIFERKNGNLSGGKNEIR